MRAVHLTRKLDLEAPQDVPDGAGGFQTAWVRLGSVWADFRPGFGRERAEGAATLSRLTHRIVVRAATVGAASRPAPDQRFRDGVRVFPILAVAEHDPAGHYLACFCEEETVA